MVGCQHWLTEAPDGTRLHKRGQPLRCPVARWLTSVLWFGIVAVHEGHDLERWCLPLASLAISVRRLVAWKCCTVSKPSLRERSEGNGHDGSGRAFSDRARKSGGHFLPFERSYRLAAVTIGGRHVIFHVFQRVATWRLSSNPAKRS
eukprot:3765224-Prymnesium_polylepis.1